MKSKQSMVTRRAFLGAAATTSASLAALAVVPGVEGRKAPIPGAPAPGSLEDNVYTRLLGVRPHLGAHEHISRLGGGRMPPEVVQAMAEANEYMVDIHELQDAAGKRAATLLGAEAALVTAGRFSRLIPLAA